jgi:cell division protein FtsB
MTDNGFLSQLKVFISRYKYWIVFVLFLLIILVASDNSMVKRVVQKREIHELQEQLRRSTEQKHQNELMINDLNNDSLVIDRIAREKYIMHREDEDLFIENER